MAEHRTGGQWAARAAVLGLTVLGLVGLHGLPDAMASSNGSAAMSTSAAMSPSAVMSTSAGAASTPAVGAGPRVGAPAGCAMDHTNCAAVQRESAHLAAPDTALTTAAAPEPPASSAVPAASRNPRAPPDVSLTELGISRT